MGEKVQKLRDLRITTVNVCALRNHVDEILEEVEADCIFVQESGLTVYNAGAVRAGLHRHEVDLTTGPMLDVTARYNGKTKRMFKEGEGSMKGGVAVLHKVPVIPMEFDVEELKGTEQEVEEDLASLEEAIRFLKSTKRFQAVAIPFDEGILNVINVYGYSGANSRTEDKVANEKFLEAVTFVAAGLGDVPTIILGDFNVAVAKSPTIMGLLEEGWTNAATLYNMEDEFTFFATEEDEELGQGSVIDHVLLNPAATPMINGMKMGERRRTGGHREINVVLKNVLKNEYGSSFKAPKRSMMDKENVKSKAERKEVTADIIEEGRREVEELMKKEDLSEAWEKIIQIASRPSANRPK